MFLKKILPLFLFFALTQSAVAQFGFGGVVTNDIYVRAANPSDDIASEGAGSALLNLGVGPKIWMGGEKVSLSLEALAVISPLALSLKDYKGLGMVSYPLLAKLNFNGLSTLDKEGQPGFFVGGGLQYTRTELFYVKDEFKNKGGKRELFRNYVATFGYGFGMSGFAGSAFVKYGWGDDNSNIMSLGIQLDFNAPMLKKITDPASSL